MTAHSEPGTLAEASLEETFAAAYGELHRMAGRRLRAAPLLTLSATCLIHELYLKLEATRSLPASRGHFLALASRAMRQIIIDYARARAALKRGGPSRPLSLNERDAASECDRTNLLAIDLALEKLSAVSPRLVRVVECRFFAGLEECETAEALGCSVSTVQRDWRRAKAWLRLHLEEAP